MSAIHDLVGVSPALSKVIRFIEIAARSKSSVILGGESGTGKELVARAIHRNSARSNRPFIVLNCAAVPEETFENELFGHEREAFTGATSRRKGKLDIADGGTLFLDEIGEIGRRVQAKLLRAVEYGEVQTLGGSAPTRVNVRWIAATNRDLRAAAYANEFRLDLFCRLNVLSVDLPPLRERPEDIPILIRHFMSLSEDSEQVSDIAPEAEEILARFHWPGNVRQLKHVIEQAMAFASAYGDRIIQRNHLPDSMIADLSAAAFGGHPSSGEEGKARSLNEAVFRAKREFVQQAMVAMRGDALKVASVLGIHPSGLARLLDKLRLKKLKKE